MYPQPPSKDNVNVENLKYSKKKGNSEVVTLLWVACKMALSFRF